MDEDKWVAEWMKAMAISKPGITGCIVRAIRSPEWREIHTK
jgi:hypothetical protein